MPASACVGNVPLRSCAWTLAAPPLLAATRCFGVSFFHERSKNAFRRAAPSRRFGGSRRDRKARRRGPGSRTVSSERARFRQENRPRRRVGDRSVSAFGALGPLRAFVE